MDLLASYKSWLDYISSNSPTVNSVPGGPLPNIGAMQWWFFDPKLGLLTLRGVLEKELEYVRTMAEVYQKHDFDIVAYSKEKFSEYKTIKLEIYEQDKLLHAVDYPFMEDRVDSEEYLAMIEHSIRGFFKRTYSTDNNPLNYSVEEVEICAPKLIIRLDNSDSLNKDYTAFRMGKVSAHESI